MFQLTNLAFFRARRGQTEALGAALAALVEPTRGEAGCLNYDLHQSLENAEIWFVYENWRSMQGLDSHMKSVHLRIFLTAAPDPRRGRHRPSSIHHDFDARNALTPIF